MLELGRINRLEVARIDDDGAWLGRGDEQVLLPAGELTGEVVVGGTLDVFVYADRTGRLIATLRRPLAAAGEFALLHVRLVNEHGAFMDWGLTKDLLVPHREQLEEMKPGRSYLVKVRLDREGRPIGTARIDKCLSSADETIADGQAVDLVVWEFTDLGAKVIVNHRFGGLLYRDEIGDRFRRGDLLQGFIRRIRADGKIDCTLNPGTRDVRDQATATILQALADCNGFLPLHDGSPAEQVQEMLGMSKKLFKKSVGGLYKAGLVELTGDGIRTKKKPDPV